MFENIISVSVMCTLPYSKYLLISRCAFPRFHPNQTISKIFDNTPQKYINTSKSPLLINSCTNDVQFPLSTSAKADKLFSEGKFVLGYKREYFEGMLHGFAVRGDMTDSVVKKAKEGVFESIVAWFIEKL